MTISSRYFKRTQLPDHREDQYNSIFESPIVKISVGSADEIPVHFYAHKDLLTKIPYFYAALRKDAFIEGQKLTINFEQENPDSFRRFFEYLYTGEFYPRRSIDKSTGRFEIPLSIRRVINVLPMFEKKEFESPLEIEMASGSYVTTKETHKHFENLVQLLGFAERFGMEDFLKACTQKVLRFPVGAKEVAVLAGEIIPNLPESRTEIYTFLEKHIRHHLFRLPDCEEFQSLYSEDSLDWMDKELEKLITSAEETQKKISEKCLKITRSTKWAEAKLAVCTEDVKISCSFKKYGTDAPEKYGMKFGEAKKGEVLVFHGCVDERGLIVGHVLMDEQFAGWVGAGLAYPVSSFELLDLTQEWLGVAIKR